MEAKSLHFKYIVRSFGSKRNTKHLKISQLRSDFGPIPEPSHRIRLTFATITYNHITESKYQTQCKRLNGPTATQWCVPLSLCMNTETVPQSFIILCSEDHKAIRRVQSQQSSNQKKHSFDIKVENDVT